MTEDGVTKIRSFILLEPVCETFYVHLGIGLLREPFLNYSKHKPLENLKNVENVNHILFFNSLLYFRKFTFFTYNSHYSLVMNSSYDPFRSFISNVFNFSCV